MTLSLIILAFWLVPGIVAYIITAWYSKQWLPESRDLTLLLPVVNWIMLGFVLCILFDEFLTRIRL